MIKMAPLAVVKKEYGSKEKLAGQLASTMDVPEGKTREQFQKFLQGLSNTKLLKLKRVEEAFKARFGGKPEKAVSAILERRKLTGKAADAFKEQAQGFSKARLLDLAGPEATAAAKPATKKPAKKA